MEAAILAQDPALDRAAGPAPPRPSGRRRPTAATGRVPVQGPGRLPGRPTPPLFHGRRRLVASLVARLVDAPLLVVSGPSGAGKSSVVRAGLVPALAGGALPGSQAWRPVVVTPGRRAGRRPRGADRGDAARRARSSSSATSSRSCGHPAVDPAERTAFLDAVLGPPRRRDRRRGASLVVRGDHVGRLAEHAAFAERLGGALVLVPPLTDAELREIVREPAGHGRPHGRAGTASTPSSPTCSGRPGALPLLSTALVGTWERRRGNRLTLAGYLEAGGVAGALTRSAETRLRGARRGRPGAGAAAAGPARRRRRRRRAGPAAGAARRARPRRRPGGRRGRWSRRSSPGACWPWTATASRSPTRPCSPPGRGWPAGWRTTRPAGRCGGTSPRPRASGTAGGRPDDELYRGARLAAALDWAARPGRRPHPGRASSSSTPRGRAADAELTEARDRADREAAARRRTRRLAAGLAAVLVVALVAHGAGRAVASGTRERGVASWPTPTGWPPCRRRRARSTSPSCSPPRPSASPDTPETQDGLLAALAEHGRAVRVVAVRRAYPYGHAASATTAVALPRRRRPASAWQIGPDSRAAAGVPGRWPGVDGSRTPHRPTTCCWRPGRSTGGPWVRTGRAGRLDPRCSRRAAVGGVPMGGAFTPDGRRVHLLVAAPDAEAADGAGGGGWSTSTPRTGSVRDDRHRRRGRRRRSTTLGATSPTTAGSPSSGTPRAARPHRDRPRRRAGRRRCRARQRPAASLVPAAAVRRGAAVGRRDRDALRPAAARRSSSSTVHQQPVRDVAVAPDGTWAVTAGDGARSSCGTSTPRPAAGPSARSWPATTATSSTSPSTRPGSGCTRCRWTTR